MLNKQIFENTEIAFKLKSDTEIERAYFLFKMISHQPLVRIGTAATNFALKAHLPVEGLIRSTVFDHFCGGVNEDDCLPVIDKMFEKGVCSVLDYSVEGKDSEEAFENTLQETLRTIENAKGAKSELKVDRVISAVGVVGNIEGLGLEALGVETDRGCVVIDGYGDTNVPGIYAIGDVAGPPMLAHKGQREGHVVADIIAGHKHHPVNYGNIPNATYCHPEVASIGLTEAQCKEKGLKYKIGKFPFSANGRARTSGETEGFVKVIRDEKYGEILGAHIIGAHATELIHEIAVARENEYTVEEIDLAIHAHPTLSEGIAEAVLDSMGKMLHA